MEEYVKNIINKNYADEKSDFPVDSAKEIAEHFEKFMEWVHDTCIGYGSGWLLKPYTYDEKMFETSKELYSYWSTNINN